MRVANCVPQAQWELELYEERASQGKLYCRGTQLPPDITETGEKGRWNTPTCLSSLLSDLSPSSVSRWVEVGLQERDWVTRPVAVILQGTRHDREGWRLGVKRRITRTKRACLPFTEDRLYFTSHHSPRARGPHPEPVTLPEPLNCGVMFRGYCGHIIGQLFKDQM